MRGCGGGRAVARREIVVHVYMMASASGVLYLGVTSELERRVGEHKKGVRGGFSSQHKTVKLVYFEEFGDVREAMTAMQEWEKRRVWKVLGLKGLWRCVNLDLVGMGR